MIFHGMTCVRNEARWIKESIASLLPLCDFVFVLDDHSTDDTVEICRAFGSRVIVYQDEEDKDRDAVRDKNAIYSILLQRLPPALLNETSPYWVVSIDGDEVLEPNGPALVREAIEGRGKASTKALSLQVCYLWDAPDSMRVDGVYGEFYRPSVFRVINPTFDWKKTRFPNNTHCPCIPDELVGWSVRCPVRLKHYGYLHKEDRIAKFRAKSLIDPNNIGEDYYRHMVQGDLPSVPPDATLKHAGPLKLTKCDF